MTDTAIKRWTWVARVLVLLTVLGGIAGGAQQLPAFVRDYATLAVSLLGACSAWVYSILPAGKMQPKLPPAGPAVLVMVLLVVAAALVLPACTASSRKIAATTIRGVQQARDLTAVQLAAAMRSKHTSCLAKHGAKTPGFVACVGPVLAAQKLWATGIRPSADTSCNAGRVALKTEAFVKACMKAKDCEKRILDFLKLGYCAISRGLNSFGALLSDGGRAVLSALTMFEGVICGN